MVVKSNAKELRNGQNETCSVAFSLLLFLKNIIFSNIITCYCSVQSLSHTEKVVNYFTFIFIFVNTQDAQSI